MVPMSPEDLLSDFPGPMAEIGQWLRGVVRATLPGVIERVRPGWRLIGYDLPIIGRRTAYLAFIAPEPIHVHLGFEHGTLMDDPLGLLQGVGITKKVRWVTLTPGAMLPEPALADLLRGAARVAAMSPDERRFLADLGDGDGP